MKINIDVHNLLHANLFQILHRLAARAIIKDWEDGSLSEDRIQHELLRREMKDKIVNLSKEHSIVTQFTSFVAIEKREDGEKFDDKDAQCLSTSLSRWN